jgi:polyisoprenoid-binding protein YceI
MFKSIRIAAASFLFVGALASAASATEYQIDPAHSEITFRIKHMGISTVTGKFEKFEGSFNVDPKDIKTTKGEAVMDVASLSTGNAKRDTHLKSDDFFNAQKYPRISFKSKDVKDVNMGDSTCTLVGDLTIRDVTKEVTLKVKGDGILPNDGWGNERAAFHATGAINRFDFNLKWNKAVEAGRLVAGETVDLVLSFEGVHKVGGAPEAAKGAEKATKDESKASKKKSPAPAAAPSADTSSGVKGGTQSHTKSGY